MGVGQMTIPGKYHHRSKIAVTYIRCNQSCRKRKWPFDNGITSLFFFKQLPETCSLDINNFHSCEIHKN